MLSNFTKHFCIQCTHIITENFTYKIALIRFKDMEINISYFEKKEIAHRFIVTDTENLDICQYISYYLLCLPKQVIL